MPSAGETSWTTQTSRSSLNLALHLSITWANKSIPTSGLITDPSPSPGGGTNPWNTSLISFEDNRNSIRNYRNSLKDKDGRHPDGMKECLILHDVRLPAKERWFRSGHFNSSFARALTSLVYIGNEFLRAPTLSDPYWPDISIGTRRQRQPVHVHVSEIQTWPHLVGRVLVGGPSWRDTSPLSGKQKPDC